MQEQVYEGIDEQLKAILREESENDPVIEVHNLLSSKGKELMKKRIEVPQELSLERRVGYEERPTENFFNLLQETQAKTLVLAGRYAELEKAEESPAYDFYLRAKDKLKSLVLGIESYSREELLEEQIKNLKSQNGAIAKLVNYSVGGILAISKNRGERGMEVDYLGGRIEETKRKEKGIGEKLKRIERNTPRRLSRNPDNWNEGDGVRAALLWKAEDVYLDIRDTHKLYEEMFSQSVEEANFLDALTKVFTKSTRNLERILKNGLYTQRLVNEIKDILDTIRKQGEITGVYRKQIRDLGETMLGQYNYGKRAIREICYSAQTPVFDSYRERMGDSLRELIDEERNVDLEKLIP